MKVKELLNSPEKWTKRENARDINGIFIEANNPNACSFCLQGAMYKCYGYINSLEYHQKLVTAIEKLYPRDYWNVCENIVVKFNDSDSITFEDIQKVLELADI